MMNIDSQLNSFWSSGLEKNNGGIFIPYTLSFDENKGAFTVPQLLMNFLVSVVGEVMKEKRRRERERLINLSTCGCVIQLYLWENTQFIEIREFGWGFLMLTS